MALSPSNLPPFFVRINGAGTEYRYASQSATVATFADASSIVREFIEHHGLGSRDFGGASIHRYSDGNLVARVTYNGRVWDLDGKPVVHAFCAEAGRIPENGS